MTVLSVSITPPSGISSVRVRRQLQVDVAVREAGLRELADLGARAAPQRRVIVVDRELDLGVAVVGDLDALDRADRHAAHLDGVALHELTGVQEARLDLVAAPAAAEEDEGRPARRQRSARRQRLRVR